MMIMCDVMWIVDLSTVKKKFSEKIPFMVRDHMNALLLYL